jgi:hypothetical protein
MDFSQPRKSHTSNGTFFWGRTGNVSFATNLGGGLPSLKFLLNKLDCFYEGYNVYLGNPNVDFYSSKPNFEV